MPQRNYLTLIKPRNYIKNSDLLRLITTHNSATKLAKAEGREGPPIPDSIGLAFWVMATKLGERYNFRKYPFIDEMIADAYEDCLKRMHNFDPAISSSAFAYFTRAIWNAFVRRIKTEKRYLRAKIELTERLNLLGLTSDSNDGDHTNYGIEVNQTEDSLEYLR